MHIGLFGGSFDPPHVCHVLLCLYALEMTDVEKILWVPCADHPLGKTMAPFEHRLEMSRLAAEPLGACVEVSDIESELPGPSYTILTVKALQVRMPDEHISVLTGSDIVGEIDRWEQIEELQRLTDFIIVPRGGYVDAENELAPALPLLSSTTIREALRVGESVERVLTPAVREYIVQHNLYRQ